MIKITNGPNLKQSEIIHVVREVVNKGKFSGSFNSESFFRYSTHTIKVVSWNDGERTDYFHVTRQEKK